MKTETMQKKLETVTAIIDKIDLDALDAGYETGELNRTLKILNRRAEQLRRHLELKQGKGAE